MKLPNVEKAMEGKGDGSTAKELMKLAEKDPMSHMELELNMALEQRYQEAKEKGFEGTFDDWIKTAPIEDLRDLLADGGPLDLSGLSVGQMKAIFRSENGRDPKNIKELVRGVKMYLKNMDLKGMPFKKDGGLISSYKANLRKP